MTEQWPEEFYDESREDCPDENDEGMEDSD